MTPITKATASIMTEPTIAFKKPPPLPKNVISDCDWVKNCRLRLANPFETKSLRIKKSGSSTINVPKPIKTIAIVFWARLAGLSVLEIPVFRVWFSTRVTMFTPSLEA